MKRNSYSPEIKAEVVLDVLSGLKTIQQIAQERGIHPVSVTSWVKEARAKMPAIFKGEIQDPEVALQKEIDTLHRKIGQMAVENDFLPEGMLRDKKGVGEMEVEQRIALVEKGH